MYVSIFCESNETLVKKTVINRCKHIAIIGGQYGRFRLRLPKALYGLL